MKGFLTLIVAAVLLYLIAMSFGLVGAPSGRSYPVGALAVISLIGVALMVRARLGGGQK